MVKVKEIEINLPESSSDSKSVILLGLPKSGTTLLSNIFKLAASYLGVGFVPLHDNLFKLGLEQESDNILDPLHVLLLNQGYCYGAFRKFFNFINHDFLSSASKIMIVRDPKDMMVSDYFSMAYSHPKPGNKTEEQYAQWQISLQERDINTVVRERFHDYIRRMQKYREILTQYSFKVYKYEEIIFNKYDWTVDMMSYCNWSLTDEQISQIVEAVDIFPKNENKAAHIRQVAPGNYKKYLEQSTIDFIDGYSSLFSF
jgi:hypothetical protein